MARTNELRFKHSMLTLLRYSARKQATLREGLIMTVEKRNYERARLFLSEWQRATYFKINFKQSLRERVVHFTVLRVLKRMKASGELKARKAHVDGLCHEFNAHMLKAKVWNGLISYYSSTGVVGRRKARTYRRRQLLAPSFVGLKRYCWLKKMHNDIKAIQLVNTKKHFLGLWVGQTVAAKFEKHSQRFSQKKLVAKSFKVLKQLRGRTCTKEKKKFDAGEFDRERLLRTAW